MLVSIALPIHDMKNKDFFLERCLRSIREQTYTDWELVITEEGKMAENTNAAIKQSYGDIIKILYMDDFFAHKDALKNIVEAFTPKTDWLVTGCTHTRGTDRFNKHLPTYNNEIHLGKNTIGSPSVLAIRNNNPLLFDEEMTWLLDCDYYKRMFKKHGAPTILNDINVVIGVGDHQATNTMGDAVKEDEYVYMIKKYAKSN